MYEAATNTKFRTKTKAFHLIKIRTETENGQNLCFPVYIYIYKYPLRNRLPCYTRLYRSNAFPTTKPRINYKGTELPCLGLIYPLKCNEWKLWNHSMRSYLAPWLSKLQTNLDFQPRTYIHTNRRRNIDFECIRCDIWTLNKVIVTKVIVTSWLAPVINRYCFVITHPDLNDAGLRFVITRSLRSVEGHCENVGFGSFFQLSVYAEGIKLTQQRVGVTS